MKDLLAILAAVVAVVPCFAREVGGVADNRPQHRADRDGARSRPRRPRPRRIELDNFDII